MFAIVRRGCSRAVRLVLHDRAWALGLRATVVRCHRARRVHQDVAHVRYMWSIRIGGCVVTGRLRERLQSLDQLRFRARHRQVSSFQFHLEVTHCKRDTGNYFSSPGGASPTIRLQYSYLSYLPVCPKASMEAVPKDCSKNSTEPGWRRLRYFRSRYQRRSRYL